MSNYLSKNVTVILILFCFVFINCAKKTEQKSEDISTNKPINKTATLEFKIKARLGEGAIWNQKTDELYWVDIEGKTLNIYNPKTKTNKTLNTPTRIGTVVPYTKDEAVVALEDGIYSISLNSNALKLISDVEAKVTTNRFNDGKCDPNGNLWVGSMHYPQTLPNAKLYKVDPQGNATAMVDSVTISNGIVWTKDTKKMYYIDTPTGTIKSYDYDIKTSTNTNEKIAVNVPKSLGYPDGMTIDQDNLLWVGLWNGNGIAQFDPITGKLLQKIDVPAHNVTSCAFGGDNLDTLYITTSTEDMTEEEQKKYPLAGSIFKVKPGAKGVPAYFFNETVR